MQAPQHLTQAQELLIQQGQGVGCAALLSGRRFPLAGGAAARRHERLGRRGEDGDLSWAGGGAGGCCQAPGGQRRRRRAADVQSSQVNQGVEIIGGVTPCSRQEKSTTRKKGKRLKANPVCARN